MAEVKRMENFPDIDSPEGRAMIHEALNQPGGYRQILYMGLVIVAPLTHIKNAIEMLTPEYRIKILQEVDETLTTLFPKILAKMATQEEAMCFCTNVVVWFANEVNEGRETLEVKVN